MTAATTNGVPLKRRFDIWRRDGFQCVYCNRSALTEDITLEVDHIVPVNQGGGDEDSNLTTACTLCNRWKDPKPVSSLRVLTSVAAGDNFLNSVRHHRRQRRLTRRQLAQATGISETSIKNLENGGRHSPRGSTMVRLAMFFGLPIQTLFWLPEHAEATS